MIRTRWAAVGAAVAVTLGAGGLGVGFAVSPGAAVSYVPITPCRVLDTRPGPENVGNRNTPIGGEAHRVAVHGDNGGCTGLPDDATGVSLNVTALHATRPTFLTVWPADAPRPTASNLNPSPGAPPTPNAVTTGLSSAGEFDVYNGYGTVDVVIDVDGYYSGHAHSSTDIVDEPGVAENFATPALSLGSSPTSVVSTSMRVPADGYVTIEASARWRNNHVSARGAMRCQLQHGAASAVDVSVPFLDVLSGGTAEPRYDTFSAVRVVPVSRADNPSLVATGQTFRLVCAETLGDVEIDTASIVVTYFPTSYAPIGLSGQS